MYTWLLSNNIVRLLLYINSTCWWSLKSDTVCSVYSCRLSWSNEDLYWSFLLYTCQPSWIIETVRITPSLICSTMLKHRNCILINPALLCIFTCRGYVFIWLQINQRVLPTCWGFSSLHWTNGCGHHYTIRQRWSRREKSSFLRNIAGPQCISWRYNWHKSSSRAVRSQIKKLMRIILRRLGSKMKPEIGVEQCRFA